MKTNQRTSAFHVARKLLDEMYVLSFDGKYITPEKLRNLELTVDISNIKEGALHAIDSRSYDRNIFWDDCYKYLKESTDFIKYGEWYGVQVTSPEIIESLRNQQDEMLKSVNAYTQRWIMYQQLFGEKEERMPKKE